MTLIDGIGDEVVHFAAVVIVLVIAAVSWWSTNARPVRYRAVLLTRPHTSRSVRLSIRTGAPPPAILHTSRQSNASGQVSTETVTVSSAANGIESSPSANAEDVVPLQEMDSIVDADMALLDNNRLRFYRRVQSPRAIQTATESAAIEAETQEAAEPASNEQIREMDSIVSAMEADESTNCDVFSRPNGNDSNSTTLKSRVEKEKKDSKESATETATGNGTDLNAEGDQTTENSAANNANDRKILIKLKYLNDTLKEVEGSLDELLKDFKWRHFSNELMSEFRVRLIFNGRVLGDEAATLRALGLHHRAVVHCLVHPRRAPPAHDSGGGGEDRVVHGALEGGAPRAPERAWDLENILMTLVSVALTVVWFFRCEYSNMFTASASVALFGLTVFYSVAIFGLYLSDTFHFDRRQPQPVPNN